MHLLPDQRIFGVAPALLIDCARQIHDRDSEDERFTLGVHGFARALGAPLSESGPVLRAMLESGFFELANGEADRYVPTQKLGQLALASISPGITRAEAETLLTRIVDKVERINACPDVYDHRITCVVVFGSYLTDKLFLGDLDIGVALEELPGRRHRRDGEGVDAWLRRAGAARNRVLRALRLRQPKKISVHGLDEVLHLGTPFGLVVGVLPESGQVS